MQRALLMRAVCGAAAVREVRARLAREGDAPGAQDDGALPAKPKQKARRQLSFALRRPKWV